MVTPSEVTVDLSGAECETQEGSWSSYVRTPCGDKLPAPKVRSRLGDGEFHDCAVQSPTPALRGTCDYSFDCPTESATGRGRYGVEITAPSGKRHLDFLEVYDDGCSPLDWGARSGDGRVALTVE